MIKEGNVKMTAKEFYETIGQNYEEVLERLAGSEALVLRFLKKFSTDKTFSELEKAMEARDIEMIFRQSHTLKGVAANLGLKPLFLSTPRFSWRSHVTAAARASMKPLRRSRRIMRKSSV